jgi:plasmid stabilization system protein ParE
VRSSTPAGHHHRKENVAETDESLRRLVDELSLRNGELQHEVAVLENEMRSLRQLSEQTAIGKTAAEKEVDRLRKKEDELREEARVGRQREGMF